MIPLDQEIERVVRDLGCGRMQAINHLRQREALRRRLNIRPHTLTFVTGVTNHGIR